MSIVSTIRTRPDEEWLVVYHKYNPRYLEIDVPSRVIKALGNPRECKVKFLNWGNHSATNAYCDVPNVILAGTLFYEVSYYEALGRGRANLNREKLCLLAISM